MASLTKLTVGMENGVEAIEGNFEAVNTELEAKTTDTKWKALPLASGVTGTSSHTPQYRMLGTHVTLRGSVDMTKAGNISVMPVKPTGELCFGTAQMSGTITDRATIYAEATGELNLIVASNYGKHISLDGISFFTD